MITIFGASGKTGSQTAEILLSKGQTVRALGRSAENLSDLKAKGAELAIGDQSDVEFLKKALQGSDAVYLLIPPKMDAPDVRGFYNQLSNAALVAISDAKPKRLVVLSSLGAERTEGTGPVLGLHDLENKLKEIKDIAIRILRPSFFMENLMMNIGLIKSQGMHGSTAAAEAKFNLVATADIATKSAELLSSDFTGSEIIEIYGDQQSYKSMTEAIGKAIGKPDLVYMQFPPEAAQAAMQQMGLSASMAAAYAELGVGLNSGKLDPTINDPAKPTSTTRFDDFLKKFFVPAYNAG